MIHNFSDPFLMPFVRKRHKYQIAGLTGAWRLLALLRLSSLSLTVFASQLWGGGVAEADTGDDTRATGDGAG